MPIIAGVRVPREPTLELAAMLTRDGSDRTARLLLEAITHDREFVALTTDDREASVSTRVSDRSLLVNAGAGRRQGSPESSLEWRSPPLVARVTWMRPSGCLLPWWARAFRSCVKTAS